MDAPSIFGSSQGDACRPEEENQAWTLPSLSENYAHALGSPSPSTHKAASIFHFYSGNGYIFRLREWMKSTRRGTNNAHKLLVSYLKEMLTWKLCDEVPQQISDGSELEPVYKKEFSLTSQHWNKEIINDISYLDFNEAKFIEVHFQYFWVTYFNRWNVPSRGGILELQFQRERLNWATPNKFIGIHFAAIQ